MINKVFSSTTPFATWHLVLVLMAVASGDALHGGTPVPPTQPPFRARASLRTDWFLDGGVVVGINNLNDYILSPIYFGSVLGKWWETPHTGASGRWTAGAMAFPIEQGPESFMGGLFLGHRITWDHGPWALFVEARGGIGLIDSQDVPDAQGQDFIFQGAAQAGVEWRLNTQFTLALGILYTHISNGNLSEPERPNIGLDAIGPFAGARWRF